MLGFSGTDQAILLIDESGFGKDASIIGVLRSTNIEKAESAIRILRKKHNYRSLLYYRSTDKYKVPFAKDLIDYFFEERTLHFYARFISRSANPNNNKNSETDIIYKVNMREIITAAAGKTSPSLLVTASRGRYSSLDEKKDELGAYLKKNLQFPHNLKYEANKYGLYQLADLFTGSIFADKEGVKNDIKLDLLNYLKNKLKVRHLSEIYNRPGAQKFVIKNQ